MLNLPPTILMDLLKQNTPMLMSPSFLTTD